MQYKLLKNCVRAVVLAADGDEEGQGFPALLITEGGLPCTLSQAAYFVRIGSTTDVDRAAIFAHGYLAGMDETRSHRMKCPAVEFDRVSQ